MIQLTKEQEEQVINFGVFDYPADKISSILGIELSEIKKDLANEKSKLNQLLEKGKNISEYIIDLKLFDMAKNGDIKALDKLESRKRERNY